MSSIKTSVNTETHPSNPKYKEELTTELRKIKLRLEDNVYRLVQYTNCQLQLSHDALKQCVACAYAEAGMKRRFEYPVEAELLFIRQHVGLAMSRDRVKHVLKKDEKANIYTSKKQRR